MINIRVLLIKRILIILKHFGDLDFECYIYIYIYMCVCVCVCVCVCLRVCVEKERCNFIFKNGDLGISI